VKTFVDHTHITYIYISIIYIFTYHHTPQYKQTCRLKHQLNSAGESFFARFQEFSRSEQHGHMCVVAARVHFPGALGDEVCCSFHYLLIHRQGIHVYVYAFRVWGLGFWV